MCVLIHHVLHIPLCLLLGFAPCSRKTSLPDMGTLQLWAERTLNVQFLLSIGTSGNAQRCERQTSLSPSADTLFTSKRSQNISHFTRSTEHMLGQYYEAAMPLWDICVLCHSLLPPLCLAILVLVVEIFCHFFLLLKKNMFHFPSRSWLQG